MIISFLIIVIELHTLNYDIFIYFFIHFIIILITLPFILDLLSKYISVPKSLYFSIYILSLQCKYFSKFSIILIKLYLSFILQIFNNLFLIYLNTLSIYYILLGTMLYISNFIYYHILRIFLVNFYFLFLFFNYYHYTQYSTSMIIKIYEIYFLLINILYTNSSSTLQSVLSSFF